MDCAFKLTTNGRALIAACGALEKPLRISRAAVGSGVAPENTNLADIHDLIQYVAEGKIAERRHDGNQLYLTVQYANNEHKEQSAFYLSEFIVYALHPETGVETDLLYATLGDYRQIVPAYRSDLPSSVFNFPLLIVISDDIQVDVTAAPGLVSHDDLQRLLNDGIIGISRAEITIQASAWQKNDAGAIKRCTFFAEIPVTGATEHMTPVLTIYPECLDKAKYICPSIQTFEGGLRVFAEIAPTGEIKASLSLIGGSGYIGTNETSYVLPVATATRLGGVKIGNGIDAKSDGTISSRLSEEDLITADETAEMLKEIFPSSQ